MTVAAHGGDIYQNQITYDFSVNTNPLPLPEILQKRMAEAAVHSNRYPQYDNVLLRERLAALYGFSTEEVVCGNGASELFVAIVHALRPKQVGILAPSFRDMPGQLRQWEPRYAVSRCRKKIILPWTWHRWKSLCRRSGWNQLIIFGESSESGGKQNGSVSFGDAS